jgi:uncharacterized C2H2 Zn-finger protein
MEENKDDNLVSLSISISADRDLFTRHTCPKCGLDFKVSQSENDITWLLHEQIKRQGEDLGISPKEESEADVEVTFCCPYCESIFEKKESFTEEMIDYAKRIAYREIILPMIDKMFGGLEDSIGRNNRSSGGFLSISVSFQHNRQAKPPRPFHGPEPDDMKIINFLCCNQKTKILENWNSTRFCVFCQTEIVFI